MSAGTSPILAAKMGHPPHDLAPDSLRAFAALLAPA
jgi:hypothetical protein